MNRLTTLACCLTLLGCAASGDLVEPEFDGPGLSGKADGFSSIETTELAFGGEASAEFTSDFQYFAFEFTGREDAELRAEVSQRGTARDLDTTMFLYRLSDTEAPSRIASDDNSGWGDFSRIDDFRLYSEGRYAIVVGTSSAQGRGGFRVTLECLNGDCTPPPAPSSVCGEGMQRSMQECLAEIGVENGYEVPMHEAAADCARDLDLNFEYYCDGADGPAWCAPGMDTVVRACEQQLSRTFVSETDLLVRTVELDQPDFDELAAYAHESEGCGVTEESGCGVSIHAFRYEGAAPTQAEIFALARSRSPIGPGVGHTTSVHPGAISGLGASFDLDASAAIEALGVDLSEAEEGMMFQDDISWNWGDCQVDVGVAHYPTSRTIVIFDTMFCAG